MGRRPPNSGRGRRAPRMDPAELTANLFSGLQAVLRALAAERTLVVMLDDLDAADEPTFEVIRAMLGGEGSLLFVGAARSGARDMKDTPYAGFREAISEQTFFSVELDNLEQEQTRALAKTLLDGFAPPDRLFAPIYEVSKGNPLFVEGVLRHLIDAQLLQRTEDGWAVAEALPEEIPLTLEEVLRQQLAILDPATAAMLRDAAVIGPNFDFNVLKVSSGREESSGDDDALTLVEEAEQAQILRKKGGAGAEGQELEFTSRAAQEASYAEQEDKAGAHARVAEAIEQEQPQEAGALAYHFGKAGNEEQRERFLERVRERREQLFNRETIETILGAGSNLPEVTDEPSLALTAQLPRLAKSLANAAKVVRLYPRQSKSVQDAIAQLIQTLEKAHEHAPSFTIGHRGNAFTLNGHAVDRAYASGEYQEAVVGIYRTNSIKSLTFLQTAGQAELLAFLEECAKHTVAVPLERYFWRVFAKEHEVNNLGIAQKTRALTRRDGHSTGGWKRPAQPKPADEERLPILREVILHFMGTLRGLKDFPPDHELPTKGKAALDRALRQFFEHAPGLALHMGSAERDELVVNGEALAVKSLGGSAAPLRHFLRDTRLAGLVILKEITPRELSRFLDRVSQLPPRAKPEDEDPAAGIGADGSFPNVVVGEALFELAHGLVRGRAAAQTGKAELEVTLDDAPPIEELLPLPERDPDLPHDFKWPSEEAFQRAHRLWGLKPAELLQTVSAAEGEFGDCLERLMLEERHEARAAARLLVERLAINLSSQEVRDRKKVAEAFATLSRQGTGVVRERYHAALVVRLADALELETDASVFERLAECAQAVILARIADGQWDEAARLTRSLGLRRTTRSDQQEQLKHTSRQVLGEILRDPRIERLFETIEGGSHQERRKAARVLETMGDAAVERLVEALKATERSRVENFLIDMLAALVPTSENALRKEVTPSSAPEPTIKLLRASGVVCRDATPVFIAGLSHDDQTVQSAALTEARKLGGRVAQQVLVWALAHGSAQVQLESVKHLGDLARPEAVDAMIALAQTTTLVEVQRECCLAFGKLALSRSYSEKVVNVLASFLSPGLFRKDYHEDVRHAAAWALGQMTDNEVARRTLNKALDDKDKRVRLTARLTLEGKQQP